MDLHLTRWSQILHLLILTVLPHLGRSLTLSSMTKKTSRNADTQAEIILSQRSYPDTSTTYLQSDGSTAKEIWDNVGDAMQGSVGIFNKGRKICFEEYERFRSIWKRVHHDYFVRFPQACDDMKITQLEIPYSSDEH
ncbi:hypothetical protein Tco_1069808 [Tanacetum coccineum]|uniref:Uncharacterized protein n=1 Tax=Tanacetum coccineum TaxID=301880 RepID=A0ABQ5HL27_9ASTR